MVPGELFFLTEDFFSKHDPQNHLSKNKSDSTKRPYFYAFPDRAAPEIHWMVPISSQTAKYEELAKRRAAQAHRNSSNAKENAICFGDINGEKKAFLIQNIIPVTEKYIASKYMHSRVPITADEESQKTVIAASTRMLQYSYSGHANLIHTNIHRLRSALLRELQYDQLKADSSSASAVASASPSASASASASASTSKVSLEELLSKTSLETSPKLSRPSSLPKSSKKRTSGKRYQKSL